MKIICTGWQVGLRKISFIEYLHHECGYTLKESKSIKDRLVDGGETIILDVPHGKNEQEVLQVLRSLGVKCDITN